MSFRRRLLLMFALTVVVSVTAVTWIVSALARRSFDRANDQRTAGLVAQFRREFNRRGEDVSHRVQSAASSPEAARMAVAAAQSSANYNSFLDDAQTQAEAQRLDFLEFADDRGTIISSAQWPAKFGYKEPLAAAASSSAPFLKAEETPSGSALGLFAVHANSAGEHILYVIGGIRLDRTFLSTLELPTGMRVLLYENLDHASQGFSASHLISAGNSVQEAEQFAPIVQNVQRDPREYSAVVHWGSGEDETLNAFPLTGENKQLLGILLVGSSRQIYNELRGQIRSAALLASGAGLLLAVLLSSWVAARVTRPVEELAHAARQVAAGDWHTQVIASSHDEIGELAGSFNRMTHDLVEQRERLLQAERVAAWRELARRLAHELKNPLFPLQLTVENLLRSREQEPSQFEETFRESAATLLTEIANLKNIIGRFSEFSQMPQPRFQEIQLDELVASVAKLHQAQFTKANVQCLTQLSGTLGPPPSSGPADPPSRIAADPDLLRRALSNLVLNAVDAMPQGGTLTLKTIYTQSSARIEVSDTGSGLGQEECARLFTPYYTSKLHGSGLGLAIVQSIVSDHHGTINVNSEPGEGTTFTIELPDNREHLSAAHDMHV